MRSEESSSRGPAGLIRGDVAIQELESPDVPLDCFPPDCDPGVAMTIVVRTNCIMH